jgi:hypothetical protein
MEYEGGPESFHDPSREQTLTPKKQDVFGSSIEK